MVERQVVAYEPTFDQRIGLKASYISRQIDTFLGERLNVLLSKNKYEIKNNLIYGEDMEEAFIDVIKRGIEYRKKLGGENRVDKKREEAELEGFLRTQEVMCNPNTLIGTMMLSISPKGAKDSLYQHNFYDIFTLRQAQGERFVEARRYSSALTINEYKDKLSPLSFVENIRDDADFLKNPIKIDPSTTLRIFQNADQIHSYLHKDHDVMDSEEFQRIIEKCKGLKQIYIRTKDPKVLNAIMNKADEEAGIVDYDYLIEGSFELRVDQEVNFYGNQKVRAVAAGCGLSSSVSQNKEFSPFSVSDFGMTDKYGQRTFDCPECGKTNLRPENELLSKCQRCGSNKVSC